jgi:hypothetical protein
MTYSVVATDNIRSVIHTDPDGMQRVIALDVSKAYADKIAYLLNLTNSNAWGRQFDDRQMQEIKFSCLYARDFKHGTDGHNAKLIIAKFVELLDQRVPTVHQEEASRTQELKD